MEKLPEPRFTHEVSSEGIKIVIPAIKGWSVLIFVGIWFCAWSVGGVSVFNTFIIGGVGADLFVVFWCVGWFLAWIGVFCFLIWQLFGKEIILVSSIKLTRRKITFFSFFKKEYAIANIKNLEVTDAKGRGIHYMAYGEQFFGAPSLRFDYGARTIEIANGLDVTEAREIMKLIKSYLPEDRSA